MSINIRTSQTRCSGIYGLCCRTTGKWYIGQSKNIPTRWNYYSRLKCKGQCKLHAALLKYGYDEFDKVVLEYCDPMPEILLEAELRWVTQHNSIENGYNIRSPDLRAEFSDETRLKISKAKTGKSRPPATKIARKHMSLSGGHRLGTTHSPETKLKMRLAKLGKQVKPEKLHKYKKSKAHRRKLSLATTSYYARKKFALDMSGNVSKNTPNEHTQAI